jgi:serine phosphatase RsbU (regulator of sigma subunit)
VIRQDQPGKIAGRLRVAGASVALDPGGTVVVRSDGVTERLVPVGEPFASGRLLAVGGRAS